MNQYNEIIKQIKKRQKGKEKINISDLAKIINVTAETLRKYDKQGIIQALREENSYRTYSSWELTKLIRTRQLRLEGNSLIEIHDLFEKKNVKDSITHIQMKCEELEKEIEEKQRLLSWLKYRIDLINSYNLHNEDPWIQHESAIYCCVFMVGNTLTPKSGEELDQLQKWMEALPYLSVYYVILEDNKSVSCLGFTEDEKERFQLDDLAPDFILPMADYVMTNDYAKHSFEEDTSIDSIQKSLNKAKKKRIELENLVVVRMFDYVQKDGVYQSINQMMFPVKI